MAGSSVTTVQGRLWIYDDDPPDIEVWEHELVPMNLGQRGGAEWCIEHLGDHSPEDLRELFSLPPEGNFQVLFRGKLQGYWERNGLEGEEWEEDFEVTESKFVPIPDITLKEGV